MTRIPLPLALVVVVLVAAPLVIGVGATDAIAHLLVEERGLARHPAAPVVRLVAPDDGDGVGELVRVVGEARAEVGRTILDVQWRVDGGRWESVPAVPRDVPVAPFAFDAPLAPGDRVLEVRATDGDATSLPARVQLRAGSPAPPTVHVDAPRDGEGVVAGVIEFEGRASGGAQRVVAESAGKHAQATVHADGSWSLLLEVPGGISTVNVHAVGEDRSATRVVRLAAGESTAAPSLRVLTPEANAAFGSAGDGACVPACIRFAGVASHGADTVDIVLDGAPVASVATLADGAWTWEVPVASLFSGAHVASFAPLNDEARGVAREVPFHVVNGRALTLRGDDAPRLTGMPLVFNVEGEEARTARWRVDGAYVAEGATALVRLVTPGDHVLSVETTDAAGRVATRSVPLFALNRAPTVSLAADVGSLASEGTKLVATAQDADGRVVRYLWSFGDNTTAQTGLGETLHRYEREGLYRVNVTAIDDAGGASSTASVLVPVLNAPPAAAFTWSPGVPSTRDLVTFQDESRDPEGTRHRLEWMFPDGANATGETVVHRFLTRGEHEVSLRVVDGDGGIDLATRTITVRNLPAEPNFTLEPASPVAGEPVVLRDASTKLDGDIIERRWDFDDGLRTTAGEEIVHVFETPGVHRVNLTVIDDWGDAVLLTREVVVQEALPALVNLTMTPGAAAATVPIRFEVTASDLEGAVARITWEFGDGASLECDARCPEAAGSNPWVATHAYDRSGTYLANVTAIDESGLQARLPFVVRIGNHAPDTTLAIHGTAFAAFPTTFWAEASDPDGRVVHYRFDADGDGLTDCEGAAPKCAFVFERPGEYESLVDVTDDEGGRATRTLAVTILTPPEGTAPPSIALVSPEVGARLTGEVLLRGTASGARPVERVDVQLRNGSWSFSPSASAWSLAHGTSEWHLLLDTRGIPDGDYELVVRATDASAATGFRRVPVEVANGPPEPLLTIQVANLDGGDVLVEDLLVRGAAYHPGGVSVVRYRIDEGPWHAALGAPISWAVPLRELAPGPHTLTLAAYHGLDERREMRVAFERADTRPVLRVELPPDAVLYDVLHAEGHVEGQARAYWRIDDGLWEPLSLGSHWTLHEPTLGWGGGAHTIAFKATSVDGETHSDIVEFPVRIVKLKLDPAPPPFIQSEDARERDVPAPAPLLSLVGAAVIAIALGRFGRPPRSV